MAFLSLCFCTLSLSLLSLPQSVSLPAWLSYLFILFRNAVHCVTGLWLIACQFRLWHIREDNPPPHHHHHPFQHREIHIKAVTVCSFHCSHWFHTAWWSVSQESWVFYLLSVKNPGNTAAKTATCRSIPMQENTETPPPARLVRCGRVAASHKQ